MIQPNTQPEPPSGRGDYAVVARAAELCNPLMDGLEEVTLSIRGPVASSVLRWNSSIFHPVLHPALLEVMQRASEGGSFEITALDCRLDASLPVNFRSQSRDAGKALVRGLLAPKGDRLIERYRAAVLAGDSPGHLAVIHALRSSGFHFSPRVMIASYLLQEGIGAGLDGREISRFLIGTLSAAGELAVAGTNFHSLHGSPGNS
jgi:hypothetical protein